ncbi:cysteine synthase A [Neptunicella marina]|uniref:Cysteine synthase n=1 Tax=Neptunicella marina TaxID=2125989 RepID=A0A8J6LZW9_9ALTE|nr:cysteine synthase A [Neptunicella marina]MBC3764392.1 cysteine synthase A [Neptunicella marina]
MRVGQHTADLIGQTDLLKIPSLSALSGSNIYVKCEFQNPGGSIKDRAALQMVKDAMAKGELKPGMTVVEGTAGNTGIGLALVAKSFDLNALIVMPNDQSKDKERMISLYGAELKTVAPCPFANQAHFYHQARQMAEQNTNYWWANQFENTSNFRAHYLQTGREIWQQTQGNIDVLVSVAGTGGTLAGTSRYLKKQNADIEVWSVDPDGSGIFNFLQHGEYKNQGGSLTEGIGIMRLVENFKQAEIDYAVNLPDADILTIARHVQQHDGFILGSSSALNVAAAFLAGLKRPGKNIVTFACDLGERSAAKLYNPEYLASRSLAPSFASIDGLMQVYQQKEPVKVNWRMNDNIDDLVG